MTQLARNPLATLIDEAGDLGVKLADTGYHYEKALGQRAEALQHKLNAERTYADAETEFMADLAFSPDSDSEYSKAKNSETRKLAQDRALIRARTGNGPLARAWHAKTVAQQSFDEKDLAMLEMETRWKAIRCAAELQSARLRAAALQ